MTDDEERELRMEQMTVNIEKMRADMVTEQRKLAWETRKFAVSLVLGAAAIAGAGAAVGSYVTRHPPAPVVIQLPSPAK